ncbi:VRR-NUC domain-containing protein [Agarivorans sp. DSG3-1]|uniref:VRR-NUC domain-containing protein n=1 Tax=Agarivorans sp. DSG3-1 TaxID=3342249 RepID=UPI00398EF957
MKTTISEIVFTYQKSLLEAWKEGDKSWIPDELFVPDEVFNQPHYHFGEYFTLSKFQELGWHGSAYYALGNWEPNNTKYDEGRALIAKYIDPKRLSVLKALREGLLAGEPDLFLYKEDGSVLFVEVKKEKDRLSQAQLDCLSQIKSILNCDIGVVYLSEEEKDYNPKSYELDCVVIPPDWFN